MLDHYYAVIMAGGGGTRLWPLSRKSRPKQMLALFDERTLFQTAVDRILELIPYDRIYVVTIQDQVDELRRECEAIPAENFLIEPVGRGTASVIGLAAVALQRRDPQAIMAVLGSDHFIENEPGFRQLLRVGCQAAQDGYLVTLGIEPAFASTGFGYIEEGDRLSGYEGQTLYKVNRFIEKPDRQQAEEMVADGKHFWNSGMFIWQVDRILAEFQRQMPDLYAGLMEIDRSWNTPQTQAAIEKVWAKLKTETIDYGIMEGAQNVAVLPAAGLGWSDVGSWDALFDVIPGDEQDNVLIGARHIGINTERSLVYAKGQPRLVVTIGVQDLVLVDTGDVLLVCHKDQSQMVRQVVQTLKEQGKEYL